MAKIWKQLSDGEKIEELRSDIIKIMAKVNQIDSYSDVLERGISKNSADLRNLESRVATLEASASAPRPFEKSRPTKRPRKP